MSEDTTLYERFAAHVEARPEATALIWEDGPVSYGELAAMADEAYAELEAAQLADDRPIGLRARKSPRAIALVLAGLRARRPFLLPSVELAPETLSKLFAQAGASRVIEPHGARSESATLRAITDPSADIDSSEPSQWPPPEGAEDVSFMLTTSGSTGLPKIVPLPRGAVDRFTDWAAEQFEIGPGSVVANYAPLNFDLCLLDIWTTLKHGGTVLLVDQDKATQAAYLADLVADSSVHVLQAVPMLYRLLLDVAREEGRNFPNVKHVITTGDKIPSSTLEALPELFPSARFYNIYGCTETNDSFIHEFVGLASGGAPANIPIGKPLPGVKTVLLTEDGTPLSGKGTGELLVWTPFQTRGYLNTTLNPEKFTPRPDDDGGEIPFYRTGDIVQLHDDGSLTLEGRADFYVKVRGVRVSTQVVEQAITEHPDVVECAVVAVPDELAGKKLHALIRRTPESKLNSLSLRKHCAERLARTEMPSTIEFVTEPLPKTSTGKVDRKHILEQLEEMSHAHG
jgi:acyl-coenzyme A synthetase/AMP-(fatty) acid ligase